MNEEINQVFSEQEIYRIDHYLGKEMIQNISAIRFANNIFESQWNNRYIDNVQINIAEDLGVEERGGYYDKSGALKDMVQNHILQILSLLAMEPPVAFQKKNSVQKNQSIECDSHLFRRRSQNQFCPRTVCSRAIRGSAVCWVS